MRTALPAQYIPAMVTTPQAHMVIEGSEESDFTSLLRRPPSRPQRYERGRLRRHDVPRRSLAFWEAAPDRPDPIALIQQSHQGRTPDLIPIRVARMLGSPYGFLRGTAVVMAYDVAHLPYTGIMPVVCGDAHLGNFGFYASPEGELVLDLNDFDEAHPGAWEWDLRRLVAATWVAGRETGSSEHQCEEAVRSCVQSYRGQVRHLAQEPLLRRSYDRLDVGRLRKTATDKPLRAEIDRAAKKARRSTSDRVLPKFTRAAEDGRRRIVEDPPLITHLSEEESQQVGSALDDYLRTLAPHWRRVLGGYTLIDVAHKVVGVGSVGLRAYVALLEGSSPEDVVFLQLKEARRSVLAPFVHGESAWHAHQGQRVVEYQQALQTVSDPLLGWTSFGGRDYYVRQFRNMKGTISLDELQPRSLSDYARIVGALLAKGHARTSGASMIAGYVGSGDALDEALSTFARRYADQTAADHEQFVAAVRRGELPVTPGSLESMEASGSAFRPR